MKAIVLLAFGAAGATALGFALGAVWLLPLLGALVAYPFWAFELARGRPRRAVGLMLWWALFLSLATALATVALPERAAQVVWEGPEYAAEMMGWIRTGEGPEGDPSLFLPQHALHFAVFNVACLVSAGFAGLYMGAALLNYMNFYVAILALEATRPALAAALGWPPWAVIRVVGFILASVPLSSALLFRLRSWSKSANYRYWKYYLWGALLVVLDVALKAVLAPHWRDWLLKTL